MRSLRLAFDRGTLRVDADAAFLGVIPGSVWDARTDCLRAPAYRYAEILARAEEMGLDVDDGLRATLAARTTWRVPPLRDYQADALAAWRAHGRRGVVVLPTGAGKTRLALAAMAEAAVGALVLCPTRALLEHWERELEQWHSGSIGVVGDGARRLAPVTVMTFESGYRRLDECAERFGIVVADEVHHFGTGLRAEALEMCPAPFRLGLTATAPPVDSPEADRLGDLVGPVVYEVGLAALVGTHLAPVSFVRMSVRLTPDERARYRADYGPYETLAAAIRRANPGADGATVGRLMAATRDGRSALVGRERALALAAFPAAKRVLVAALVERHRADRTLVFTALARDAYDVSRELLVPALTADINRAERKDVLDRFRDGSLRAVVSARVLNEGVDVPDARVAIVIGGRLGAREHVQRIGRVLRAVPGKQALVYELVTAGTIEDRRAAVRGRLLALPG